LHTGPLAVGNLTGETPNLAIWFQYQAEPNTILISAATMRLVGDIVSNVERGSIRVPGHTNLVAAYKLSGLKV
jgi:class 3 adenylate cyclase